MKSDSIPIDSIDAYVAQFPPDVQVRLQKIRSIVAETVPDATEAIKYGIPTFVYHGNLVHFAAFARHIGFYPTSTGIEAFKDDLSAYKTAKGSVQFPLDDTIPFKLIKKIVKFRVRENSHRASLKKRKK